MRDTNKVLTANAVRSKISFEGFFINQENIMVNVIEHGGA